MTVRNLMAGYTNYTDAQELAATRGTHRDVVVTTTDTTTTTVLLAADDPGFELESAAGTPVLTVVQHVPEYS